MDRARKPHKPILFGLFYRSPNSNANYYINIENSLALALDTGVMYIVITGEVNFNTLNPQTAKKIESLALFFHYISRLTNLLILRKILHRSCK